MLECKDNMEVNEEKHRLIEENIELWKRKLLDFTKRNSMLYFKYNKKKHLKINNDYSEIYNLLVEENKELIVENMKTDYYPTGIDEEDKKLHKELEKLLSKLRIKANSIIKEKGVNTLFICIGILKWRESENSLIDIMSPILLIPVRLIKISKDSQFLLKALDSEIIINNTLIYKLNLDFGLDIDCEIDNNFDINKYRTKIMKTIKKINNWELIDEVYLGNFSFSKIAMYKDLERYEDKIYSHDVVSHLASNSNLYNPEEVEEIKKIEPQKKSEMVFQVLDADSSQQKTIELAKAGKSFVIEGPPGTGKSQTITNIIAESIAQNKKVLFVSEKLAALEVVSNRLSSIGLGDYVLELHSNKANKKGIVTELYSQYVRDRKCIVRNNKLKFSEFDNNVLQLDSYVEALHKKYPPLGYSAFIVHGELSKLSNITNVSFELDNFINLSIDDVIEMRSIIKKLEYIHKDVNQYNKNFWHNTSMKSINDNEEDNIQKILQDNIKLCQFILEQSQNINNKYKSNINSLKKFLVVSDILSKTSLNNIGNKSFFIKKDEKRIRGLIEQGRDQKKKYLNEYNKLNEIYDNEFILENSITTIESLDFLKKQMSNDYYQQLHNRNYIDKILSNMKCLIKDLEITISLKNPIILVYGDVKLINIDQFNNIYKLSSLLSQISGVPKKWIVDTDYFTRIKITILNKYKEEHENLEFKKRKISTAFNDEIIYRKVNEISLLLDKVNNNKKIIQSLYENKNLLKDMYSKSIALIDDISNRIDELFKLFDYEKNIEIKDLEKIKELIDISKEDFFCKKDWFISDKIFLMERFRNEICQQINSINNIKKELDTIFEDRIYRLNYIEIYERFLNNYVSNKFLILNSKYRKDCKLITNCLKDKSNTKFDYILSTLEKLNDYKKLEDNFHKDYNKYYDLFGPIFMEEKTDVNILDKVIKNCHRIKDIWIKFGKNSKLLDILIEKSTLDKFKFLSDTIFNDYKILNNKIEFRNTFYSDSVFDNAVSFEEIKNKLILEQKDILYSEQLINNINEGQITKSNFENYLEDLKLICKIDKIRSKIMASHEEYIQAMGNLYCGENTDWFKIEEKISCVEKINMILDNISNDKKEILIDYIFNEDGINDKLVEFNSKFKEIHDGIVDNVESVSIWFDKLRDYEITLIDILNNSKVIYTNITVLNDSIQILCQHRHLKFNSIDEIYNETLIFHRIEEIIMSQDATEFGQIFGKIYLGITTDWETINNEFLNCRHIADAFTKVGMRLSNCMIDTLCNKEEYQVLMEIIANSNINEEKLKCLDYLEKMFIDSQINEGIEIKNMDIDSLILTLNKLMKQIVNIGSVLKINNIINEASLIGIKKCIKSIINAAPKDNYLQVFNKQFYNIYLKNIYEQSEEMKEFSKAKITSSINEFKKEDFNIINLNRKRVKKIIDKQVYTKINEDVYGSEKSLLIREQSKKKRLLPIRKLFSSISKLLLDLKPCIMMSPLSISEYIDLDNVCFDMVIFDEASQVCPEDAIGAMLRGKQVIVAGDKQQLPPTKFFSSVLDDSEEYDVEDDKKIDNKYEYESILDLCSDYLCSSKLLWHYRSRHESLIAFSNKYFYNNELYTFPSSSTNKYLGVKFKYVEGRYDYAGSATNIIEAKYVVQLILEHYKEYPDKSLGVIALSTKQMECISNLLDEERRIHPELEPYFDEDREEAFFIKNLENVQGDERDTIILSVCYGYYDEARKKLSHNFGPLNRAGGERRLNVAITRAKYQMLVVSSIKGEDIDISKTSSRGAYLLKEYLNFAKDGKINETINVSAEKVFDSPLESDIYNELTKLGYIVDTQVGCSGYRIDLAIKDPNHLGNYLLGIECDGATYHSSKTARDRDRLRQQVLEGLGWKIYRIWSQDWFANKNRVIKETDKYIKSIMQNSINIDN